MAYALVLGVSLALLYVSLRGIQWRMVGEILTSIQPATAAVGVILGALPLVLRAMRWRILLEAQGRVGYSTSFWAVAAGYFGNNFLPARAGELLRSHIIQCRSELSLSYVLATAISERAADAVALVCMGALAMLFIPGLAVPALWTQAIFGALLAAGVTGLAGLVFLPLLETPLVRLCRRFPRVQNVVRQMLLGVKSFHSVRRLPPFAVLTLAIWLLDAAATTILAQALSLVVPLWLSMLLIVALSLSSALPSAPGYVGIYQFVAVTVLHPFGISASAAIAFILLTQAVGYVVTGVPGLLAITRYTPVSWRAFQRPFQPIHIQS